MKKLIISCILFLMIKISFGEVLLWVDKNPVGVGEMFNLNIELNNDDDLEEPDFKMIKGFQLINRSEQSKTTLIDNKLNRTIKWTYVILAKYPGNYKIPSLKVGKEYTKPITIKVVENNNDLNNEIVKLEVNISPMKVYPQQQILITIRIIRDGLQLVNETLTPLEIVGAKIEKINEESFQEINNGRKKLITEIIFVAIPEKSGTLILKQISYQGDEISGVNLGSIFQKFGSYSQNKGRRIFSKSDPVSIEVEPLPKQINGWWLPANKIELSEKWNNENKIFEVGDPINWSINVLAEGVYADQIPELNIKFPKEIKYYLDKPVLNTNKSTNGISGYREEIYALIPKKSGKITLPEISLIWWDVTEDRLKRSIIPSKIIEVLPKESNVKDKLNKEENIDEKNKFKNINTSEFSKSVENKNKIRWKYISISFAFLWILTTIYLVFKIRNEKKSQIKNNKEKKLNQNHFKSIKKIKKVLNEGSPKNLKKELLNWSKLYWSEDPPKGLEQIGDRMPEIKKGIKLLNEYLYSEKNYNDIMYELRNEFRNINNVKKNNNEKNESELKQIYP